jgi:hypothetical protein
MIGQLVAPSAQTDTHSARLRRLRSKRGRGGGVTVDARTWLATFLTCVVGEIVARELATEAAKISVRTELYMSLKSDDGDRRIVRRIDRLLRERGVMKKVDDGNLLCGYL